MVETRVKDKAGAANKMGQGLGRALICCMFLASAVTKLSDFDKETGGPMVCVHDLCSHPHAPVSSCTCHNDNATTDSPDDTQARSISDKNT